MAELEISYDDQCQERIAVPAADAVASGALRGSPAWRALDGDIDTPWDGTSHEEHLYIGFISPEAAPRARCLRVLQDAEECRASFITLQYYVWWGEWVTAYDVKPGDGYGWAVLYREGEVIQAPSQRRADLQYVNDVGHWHREDRGHHPDPLGRAYSTSSEELLELHVDLHQR